MGACHKHPARGRHIGEACLLVARNAEVRGVRGPQDKARLIGRETHKIHKTFKRFIITWDGNVHDSTKPRLVGFHAVRTTNVTLLFLHFH